MEKANETNPGRTNFWTEVCFVLLPAPTVAPNCCAAQTITAISATKKPCILQGSNGVRGGIDAPFNRPSRARTYDLRIRKRFGFSSKNSVFLGKKGLFTSNHPGQSIANLRKKSNDPECVPL